MELCVNVGSYVSVYFSDSAVNIGLVVGLTVGLGVPLLLVGLIICMYLINCLRTKTSYCRLKTHVIKSTPAPETTTVVTLKQPKSQYVDYQPLPVLKGAQLSSEDASPSSSAAPYPFDTTEQPLLVNYNIL